MGLSIGKGCGLKTSILLLMLASSGFFGSEAQPSVTIRAGYFCNITHAQALIGRATGRFEQALGPTAHIEWKTFNAGPRAIEALFAGAVDLIYVGPNPAITGMVRSHGEALRIVAGAASGGVALVVRSGANIRRPEDFHGKKIASPQLGNTQDVALRAWLRDNNLKTTDRGGDVQVIPLANADQLTLFQKNELDASWAPEPWATRLIHEGGAQLFLDERTLWPDQRFPTAEVVVRADFLAKHPDLLMKWLRTHVEITLWINHNLKAAQTILNDQIQRDVGRALPPAILNEALQRVEFTYDPLRPSLLVCGQRAFEQGFLGRQKPELSNLYSLDLLNAVLRERTLKTIGER
jgi:NitT/TauT family transport system substrate-binding protein